MQDARSLYIHQLLGHYRDNSVVERAEMYLVKYRYERAQENSYRYFHHNEGINFIQQYIYDLEKKVDELQYVERIIELAKVEE